MFICQPHLEGPGITRLLPCVGSISWISSRRGLGSCLWARARPRCRRGLAPNTGTLSIREMESESTAETRHPTYMVMIATLMFL